MRNDDAYDNHGHVPEADAIIEGWQDTALEWRNIEAAVGRARLNQPYGEAERERFDLFLPAGRPEGLVVFVHGGYWRRFDRQYFSHFAAGLTARGWAVAMPSYTLAPKARIAAIGLQVARAINAACALVPGGPLILAGHSAGGHLVARADCADSDLAPAVAARLRRVIAISPVSDLRPLLETTLNDTLRLDPAEAASESPALCAPRGTPTTIWVGAEERPAFLDQAKWLEEAWPEARLHIAPGRHHFDVIDPLTDPDSDLVAAILS